MSQEENLVVQVAMRRDEDVGAMEEEAVVEALRSSQLPILQALEEPTSVVLSCCSSAV